MSRVSCLLKDGQLLELESPTVMESKSNPITNLLRMVMDTRWIVHSLGQTPLVKGSLGRCMDTWLSSWD